MTHTLTGPPATAPPPPRVDRSSRGVCRRQSRAGRRAAAALAVAAALLTGLPAAGAAQSAPERLHADLAPTPDAPGRVATARLVVDLHPGQVCWDVAWEGLAPLALEVARGRDGAVGPAVIVLFEQPDPAAGETGREGCTPVDPALLGELGRQPEAFSARLRTRERPDGAARGQLMRGNPPDADQPDPSQEGGVGELPYTGPQDAVWWGLRALGVLGVLLGFGGLLLLGGRRAGGSGSGR